MSISAVASNNNESYTGFEGPGACKEFEIFDTLDPVLYGREAAKSAYRMLHARNCPAGKMTVAINNGFGGVLFHEACGHSLEATAVAKGNSIYVGEKVKESAMFIGSHDVEFIYEEDKEYAKVRSYSPEIENIKVEDMVEIGCAMEREARAYSEKVNNIETCYVSYMKNDYGIYINKFIIKIVSVIDNMRREEIMENILIVEDDNEINKMLQELLRKNNYGTSSAFSGTEALLLLENKEFDLVLLDLMLPGLSGEDVLEKINESYHVPIICVSAKDDIDTKLELIRSGADDYLTKPFNNEELIVRIGAVLRRTSKSSNHKESSVLKFKDLALDSENHVITLDGEIIELTVKEYSILELLMSNPRKVFTKQNIFESVWSEEYIMDERAVTVHVSNLRNKLKHGEDYIKTVWGIGYKMQDE